jgi:hypothetical protein
MKIVSVRNAPSIDCLPVLVQTSSIMASKCISKLARSRPPCESPNSLDYGLQVCMIMASKCISPNSLDRGLQVHLQTHSIMASNCISKLAQSQPSNVSLHSPDYGLQVRMITASKCISKLTRSRPRRVSPSSLDRHFHALFKLLSSASCSLSRYTVSGWVAI